jgi:hypothetical protein
MEAFINQQNLKLTSEMSGYTMTYAHLCKMLEDYANKRVIEELESAVILINLSRELTPTERIESILYETKLRIKELKQ